MTLPWWWWWWYDDDDDNVTSTFLVLLQLLQIEPAYWLVTRGRVLLQRTLCQETRINFVSWWQEQTGRRRNWTPHCTLLTSAFPNLEVLGWQACMRIHAQHWTMPSEWQPTPAQEELSQNCEDLSAPSGQHPLPSNGKQNPKIARSGHYSTDYCRIWQNHLLENFSQPTPFHVVHWYSTCHPFWIDPSSICKSLFIIMILWYRVKLQG